MTANESAAPAESTDASATGSRLLAASVDPADAVRTAPAAPPETQRAPRADTVRMPPRSAEAGGDPGGLTGALAAALTRALSEGPPVPPSRQDQEPGTAHGVRDFTTQCDARSGDGAQPPAGGPDDAETLLPEAWPPGESFQQEQEQEQKQEHEDEHEPERRLQAAQPAQDPATAAGSNRERRQDPARANEPRDGAPVATASKATHDELLLGLGRRFRGASLRLEFELSANITRQIFRRDFVYVSQQLHALEASRRVQGLDRKWLNGALGVIERHGEGVKTLLQLTSGEIVELIARSGHASSQVKFGTAARLEATIVSPCARAFVDLLQIADAALMQLDRAWLLGLIDPETKGQRAADCRRALQGFKEVVRQQRHVVGEQVREVNALRQAKRADDAPTADASRPLGTRRGGNGSVSAGGEAPRRPAHAETSQAQRPRHSSHEAHASHDPLSGRSRTVDESGTA